MWHKTVLLHANPCPTLEAHGGSWWPSPCLLVALPGAVRTEGVQTWEKYDGKGTALRALWSIVAIVTVSMPRCSLCVFLSFSTFPYPPPWLPCPGS